MIHTSWTRKNNFSSLVPIFYLRVRIYPEVKKMSPVKVKDFKTFIEAFLNHLQPEDEIEDLIAKNDYISAKIKGKPKRVRYYYYIDAEIWVENNKRSMF